MVIFFFFVLVVIFFFFFKYVGGEILCAGAGVCVPFELSRWIACEFRYFGDIFKL